MVLIIEWQSDMVSKYTSCRHIVYPRNVVKEESQCYLQRITKLCHLEILGSVLTCIILMCKTYVNLCISMHRSCCM